MSRLSNELLQKIIELSAHNPTIAYIMAHHRNVPGTTFEDILATMVISMDEAMRTKDLLIKELQATQAPRPIIMTNH